MIGFTKACHRIKDLLQNYIIFIPDRNEAVASPDDATAMKITRNDVLSNDEAGFEAQLPTPNTFCWRQLLL